MYWRGDVAETEMRFSCSGSTQERLPLSARNEHRPGQSECLSCVTRQLLGPVWDGSAIASESHVPPVSHIAQ
jgi:hypothetical protein